MRFESQTARIERLGASKLWYGMSSFRVPFETPALEWVVAPGGFIGRCAGCGRPIVPGLPWGSMVCGIEVIVLHLGQRRYEIYHPACAPDDVPWAHKQAPPVESATSTKPAVEPSEQLSLPGF